MSTYTDSLGLEEITPGDQAGLWGNTTNNNLALIDQAIAGVTPISFAGLSATVYTLTDRNGASDEARSAVLNLTGNAAGANTIVVPNKQKMYLVRNNTGQTVTFQTASPGDTYPVPAGYNTLVFCNGSNGVFPGILTPSVGPTQIAGGGTGVTSYTAGDMLYYVSGTTLSRLGIGSTNYFLSSSGSAPQWTQTLGVANGGTGLNTIPAGSILRGAGTAAPAAITGTAGVPGQVLTWNGSQWEPAAPASSGITSISAGAGITVNGGSGPVTSGAVTIASSGGSGVTSVSVTSPVQNTGSSTAPNIGITSNPTFSGTVSASGFTATGAASLGDQKFSVSFAGNTSGLSPTSLQLASSGNGILYIAGGAWDGSNAVSVIFNGGAQSLQITSNDNLYTGANDCYKQGATTAWIISSDVRVKKNITPYTKGLAELTQINVRNFEYNGLANSKDGAKGIGVIADEIEQILPDTVITNKVKLRPEDAERVDLKHFDNTELVYLLVNSVKELKAELDEAKAEIAALKAK